MIEFIIISTVLIILLWVGRSMRCADVRYVSYVGKPQMYKDTRTGEIVHTRLTKKQAWCLVFFRHLTFQESRFLGGE